jgi:hypothetical protein
MAEKASDKIAIIARVSPNALTAETYASDVFDLSKFHAFAVVLATGDVGNNGTVVVKVYANTANAASGGTQLTSKVFTASNFTGSGSGTAGGSYHEGVINLDAGEFRDALDGARYGYVTVTTATATSDAAVIVLGIDPRYAPASDYDLASVLEVIE